MTDGHTLRRRTTTDLLHDQDPGTRRHIAARPIAPAVDVTLPPLAVGHHMFEGLAIAKEIPPDLPWNTPSYRSVTPWLLTFEDVLVHSDAGIIAADDWVVADTLQQTDPQLQHYERIGDGIRLPPRDAIRDLPGTWLSLLGGNYANYYHWTLEGLGRLAAVSDAILDDIPGVLLPRHLTLIQRDGFDLTSLADERLLRGIAADGIVHIEKLIVPWTMTGFHRPHPMLRPYFHRLRSAAPPGPTGLPARIYIDRRAADRRVGAYRCLVNEDEVIAALAGHGFVPIQLEAHSLAEQIALFAAAEAIVAPHGAGLANIVYANAGCRLLELHMDGWVNWCFRTLAAACSLPYDAVAGRELATAPPEQGSTRLWAMPVIHMISAVDALLRAPA